MRPLPETFSPPTVKFSTRLAPELAVRLAGEADRAGLTTTHYVRMILVRHLRQLDKASAG